MCGHNVLKKFDNLKTLPDVFCKFYWSTRAYLNGLVEGSGMRMKAVVSARTASELFSLIPTAVWYTDGGFLPGEPTIGHVQ